MCIYHAIYMSVNIWENNYFRGIFCFKLGEFLPLFCEGKWPQNDPRLGPGSWSKTTFQRYFYIFDWYFIFNWYFPMLPYRYFKKIFLNQMSDDYMYDNHKWFYFFNYFRGSCRSGECLAYCEYRGLLSCVCNSGKLSPLSCVCNCAVVSYLPSHVCVTVVSLIYFLKTQIISCYFSLIYRSHLSWDNTCDGFFIEVNYHI